MEIDGWVIATIFIKFLTYLSSFSAVGGLLFLNLLKPLSNITENYLKQYIQCSAIFGIILSIALFLIQTGSLTASGLSGIFNSAMIQLMWHSPVGNSIALRVIGLFLLLVIILLLNPQNVWLSLPVVIAVLVSFCMVGHSNETDGYLLQALLALHLLGVSFWVGSLLPLKYAVITQQNDMSSAMLAHQFGKLAVWFVVGLIVVGGVIAYQFIGTFNDLFYTNYGRLLIFKIVAVVILLGFAGLNKLRIVPKMMLGDKNAFKRLSASINFEILIIIVIFVFTAVLTSVYSPII